MLTTVSQVRNTAVLVAYSLFPGYKETQISLVSELKGLRYLCCRLAVLV